MGNNSDSLNAKVHAFCQNKVGQPVGKTKTCWDLPQAALEAAGAKTSYDYQEITGKSDQDYIWGKPTNILKIQKGDILQFRDHLIKFNYETSGKMIFPDGSSVPYTYSYTRPQTRPHHSAVVSSNNGKGIVVVFEQHVRTPGKKKDTVQKNRIYISDQTSQKGTPITKSYNLQSKGDTNKLIKMFGNKAIQEIKKNYKKGKITLKEEKRSFTVKVSGNIWAYRPEPKENK